MAEEFASLLPNNSTPFERALEQVFNDSLPPEQTIKTLWNADTIPSNLLGAIAWSFSVDDWQHEWPESVKRQIIKDSYTSHAKKGTIWSVKRALMSVGFGANSEVVEGSEQRLYDGSVFADGSKLYEGYSWAKYAIKVDLGENQGLDAATPSKLRQTLLQIAPARCDLTDFNWRSDTTDNVESGQSSQIEVALTQSDVTPWIKRYDGSQKYNQGTALRFDGAQRFDGNLVYSPNQGSSLLSQHDNFLDSKITLKLKDQQRILGFYDGSILADGNFTEADGLFSEDLPMTIDVTTHLRFNGKKTYGSDGTFFDGRTRANGSARYSWYQHFSGNQTQFITVN
ncbi:phage tail protein I [Thiomicrorhabdus sp.]|uniref:phage tail protein I n=1 Tax=Thiomicrorhabdus sp. TaxID=2039724 RepID=UPI0029C65437|nr:phage tail protein I [Thiomicrorhabdus sp.]